MFHLNITQNFKFNNSYFIDIFPNEKIKFKHMIGKWKNLYG
jgi:hypothetical protein